MKLDRLFASREPRPDWASFMSVREYRTFISTVSADMEARGLEHVVDSAGGTVRLTPNGTPSATFGLSNVAQLWKQSWDGDRMALVRDHFDRVLRMMPEYEARLLDVGADFEHARSLLKVRLFPAEIGGIEMMTTYAPANGMVAALVYDLPDSVVSVNRDHIARWGVPQRDLFGIAVENVKTEPRSERQRFGSEDGGLIYALLGDSFFTATQALYLEEFLPKPAPEMGALVAVPHRHMVLYHPIEDARCLTALNSLIPMAQGIYKEGPGSISPYVYWWREAAWWHDEQFVHIPAEVSDRRIEVHPPGEFITKVLERVAGS